ncbi:MULTISPECIES: alpha-glucosidase [unclassified Marinobacterium]|uniref:alpha-glucosidase n=1 Tax=unclassified Marinobacterium TaxID=2644139 RepID=UPI001568BAA3|nr:MULTISPECIES: alpha-glucosidase [unclassified Marinobacterium]NRP10513.1 Oligo-1,6-glucosidase [Marinobacterium sp. xm-g-48]NRP83037.1 Oligo-1,6-glucosidase [Marinobacterium sp. xm-d-509]
MSNNPWWKGGIIYQIYPRSYMDSNGDGIGDLPGITSKLDYIASLGVDAIWLSPFFKSPMKDFGYDVSDYCDVDPMFGTLDDFKALVARAHELGLKVMIDQVLSHTSDQHPWFTESRSNRTNPKADWYVWADPKPDGTAPNNWLSIFGGSSWQWDTQRQQYYLHNFLTSQPDLNFHNPEVFQENLDNMRFWLDLGVDGFRLDTVNLYYHSAGLENNPPHPEGMPYINSVDASNPYVRQTHQYDLSQPENLNFLKAMRDLLNEYDDRGMVGEIGVDHTDPLQRMAEYTAGGDKLHMAYTFDLLSSEHSADYFRQVITTFKANAGDAWPCWAASNHDVKRSATRWGEQEDPNQFPLVSMAMLMSLRGSVCLYQGEELGLPEADVPFEALQDPYGIEFWPEYKGRDGCRTPMAWDNSEQAGFSNTKPWLPVDPRHLPLSVETQEQQNDSLLQKMRQFIQWRQQQPALIQGDMELVEETGEAFVFTRQSDEQSLLVAINMTGTELTVPYSGTLKSVLTGHGFSGRYENGAMVLPPYQALFAEV